MFKSAIMAGLWLAIGACASDGDDGVDGQKGADGQDGSDGAQGPAGPPASQVALPAVYTLANASGGNEVAAYVRASTGNLSRQGRFETGGAGEGAGFGSQGALVFDASRQRFFAVNPGDDSISMLQLRADGTLALLAMVDSGGAQPVSITVHGDTVYVVNQGNLGAVAVNASISGFRIAGDDLVAIAGSTRPLSATTDVHPTDIAFTPDGGFLVVAERFAHRLSTFAVVDGVAQPGSFQASEGMNPFAFDFSPEGKLIVAEVGPGANGSSVSSYSISTTGVLTPITRALPTGQTAACWIVVAGGHAYVANAGSANITGVNIAESGALTLHEDSGITAVTGAGATDLAVTPDHGFLYSLAGNPHAIHAFAIQTDGSLTSMPPLSGVPEFAAGLAAR